MKENAIEQTKPEIERITEVDDSTFELLQNSFKDVEWNRSDLEAFLVSPDNILLIAKKDNEGAGLVRAHFLARYDSKGKETLLHEIDVVPQYQGQGIGSELVEKLKEIARENGSTEVWLITNRSNTAAMKLYEKTGGKISHDDDVVFAYDL